MNFDYKQTFKCRNKSRHLLVSCVMIKLDLLPLKELWKEKIVLWLWPNICSLNWFKLSSEKLWQWGEDLILHIVLTSFSVSFQKSFLYFWSVFMKCFQLRSNLIWLMWLVSSLRHSWQRLSNVEIISKMWWCVLHLSLLLILKSI